MLCVFCGNRKNRVVDSRENKTGDVIRRRRECLKCHRRFTSYERIEGISHPVVKKDGGSELFDRSKLLKGLIKACKNRPVSVEQLERIVDEVEQHLFKGMGREISSQEIGGYVMEQLRQVDKVAYVRFASVYLEFKDVRDFTKVIERLFDRNH